MKKFRFLIVGGGLAGGYAVKTLVENEASGIGLISADSELPYDVTKLSKGYLLGEKTVEEILTNERNFYQQNQVEVLFNTKVVTFDPETKVVKTESGEEIGYENLLFCTGASPRKLNLPGNNLSNIFYLRTLSDADKIKSSLAKGKRAVIVGASFIGMELASSFAQLGLVVTVIDNGKKVFEKLGSDQISSFFEKYFAQRGVTFIHEAKTKSFNGEAVVKEVELESGEKIPADLVAVGVGVNLNLGYTANTGLKVNNGIEVNERLQTGVDNVWAAGDIANFFDPVFDKQRRIEHWDTATRHGEIAAKNMLEQATLYSGVSYYFSDIFDLSFDLIGDNTDFDETVLRGNLEEKEFMVFYLKDKVVKAFFTIGYGQTEKDRYQKFIEDKTVIEDKNTLLV